MLRFGSSCVLFFFRRRFTFCFEMWLRQRRAELRFGAHAGALFLVRSGQPRRVQEARGSVAAIVAGAGLKA